MAEGPKNSPPIDPFVVIKPHIFTSQHRLNEKRRNFAERDFQTVRTRETTIDFSIDIIDGVAFRHLADFFHVERLRPCPVKEKNRSTAAHDNCQQRDLPAVPEKAMPALLYSRPEAGGKFHHSRARQSSRGLRCAKVTDPAGRDQLHERD